MKWFFLFIFFVACGEHKGPPFEDVRDSDGDQILNYQENEKDRFIATFPLADKITGKILLNSHKDKEIYFSNYSNPTKKILNALFSDKYQRSDYYFSEYLDLELELELKTEFSYETNSDFNTLHLFFDQSFLNFREIYLRGDNYNKSLGNWSIHKKIMFNKNELEQLLSGKIKISLKLSHNSDTIFNEPKIDSIKTKTYRVFYYDGVSSQILYIARELDLESLKKLLKISDSSEVSDQFAFFNSLEISPPTWFHKIHKNGDIAFAKLTLEELRDNFLNSLEKKSFSLKRINGSNSQNFEIYPKPGSNVYLKIRPNKSIRSFQEYVESKTYYRGGGYHGFNMEIDCTFHMRKIASEISVSPQVEDLLDNLTLNIEENDFFEIQEQTDSLGVFWEIRFNASSNKIIFSLKNSPEESFTTTGQYDGRCNDPSQSAHIYPSARTNLEGHLTFNVESYIEKIE